MAALVSNLIRPLDLGSTALTRAVVAGADAAMIDGFVSGSNGIDGSSAANYFENGGTAVVTDDWYSAWAAFPSAATYDMSAVDRAFVCHYKVGSATFNNLKAVRFCLRSGSGTANWGIWEYTLDSTGNNGFYHPFMMVGTPDSTVGTFDNTDITGFAFMAQPSNTDVFAFAQYIDQLVFIDGPVNFEDTGTAATVQMQDYFDLVESSSTQDYRTQLAVKAGPAFEFGFPVRITSDDYLSSSAAEVIAFKEADSIGFPSMASGYYQLIFEPQASGSQVYSNLTAATNSTAYDLTIDGSAAGSTLDFTSCLFAGLDDVVISGANTMMASCSISSPATCDIADGDLSLTINDSVAAINWSADLVAGSTVTTNSAIDVSFGVGDYSDINIDMTASADFAVNPSTVGTYVFTGLTTTGTVNFDNDSANNTTISISGSLNNTVASPTTGGGTITITQPQDTFTITSSESSSLIQIFATGTQTLLDSTTGTSLAYVFSGTVVVDYVVQKAGFIPQRVTGVTLSDTTVNVSLIASREYDASHGLTYTTDASWSSNQLTVPTYGVTAQGVFSLMIDSFISETALRNTAFNLEMDGAGSLYLTNGAEGASDSTPENIIDGGVAYLDSSGTTTAAWSYVQSIGTATGFQGEFQQVDGSGTADARATGPFAQNIKVFGDATHGNFDYRNHLVLKYQPNGYRPVRVDVLSTYGITSLAPAVYVVAMEPQAISAATGDPAISITITKETTPVTWNGQDFSITVEDTGANSGEAILREINYNLSLDATYQGLDPFNWPEMVKELGSSYETLRGVVEGDGTPVLHGVRVIRTGGDPHPDFTRFQADNGNYYTPPVTANASITSITSGSRVRIYNETTLTETYNDVVGTSYSASYTDGTTYSSGDVINIRITQSGASAAKLPFETTVVATTSGWSAIASQEDDTVYAANGIDGSTVTKFTADFTDDEIDINSATNFTMAEAYAFYVYQLTTSQGIAEFFNGVTAIDAGNYRNNSSIVSIYWDNLTTTNVRQTDTARFFRSDGNYPVKNGGATTGGGGVDLNWLNQVYVVETGTSGLTAQESALLNDISSVKTQTDRLTFTQTGVVDANIQYVNDVEVSGTGQDNDPWGP